MRTAPGLMIALALLTGACKSADRAPLAKPPGVDPSATAPAPTSPPGPGPGATGASPPPVAEAAPEPPSAAESIAGTITLPAAQKKLVKAGETLWIVARSTGGGPPVAIQRQTVGDFPLPFVLSARDAMIPGSSFSGAINISVRVDKDGNPMTHSKGEVFGAATGVKVGAEKVTIALDSVQTEDEMLGGGPAPGHPDPGRPGMAPHGLPPDHP